LQATFDNEFKRGVQMMLDNYNAGNNPEKTYLLDFTGMFPDDIDIDDEENTSGDK